MNYWIIDVSAGCPWGYSFCVKAETEEDDRGKVIEGAAKAGLPMARLIFASLSVWKKCSRR